MQKTVSTHLTITNIAKIIGLLADSPVRLERSTWQLSKDQLIQPLRPGERSLVEILAHLLNGEARSSEAIYLALLSDEPVFVNIHPDRQFGKLVRFDLLEFSELLSYFKLRRNVLLRVLNSLSEEKWQRAIQENGKTRKETVYWRARSIAMHELEHLAEIESKFGKN